MGSISSINMENMITYVVTLVYLDSYREELLKILDCFRRERLAPGLVDVVSFHAHLLPNFWPS